MKTPTQGTLFAPTKPISRGDDEITSHLAEQDLIDSGKWAKQAGEVLALVRAMPGKTAREYDALKPGSLNAGGQCHKRLPDLEKKRLVVKGAARPCTITSRLAVTWYPAPARPRYPEDE